MRLKVGSDIYGGFSEVHLAASIATIHDSFSFEAAQNRGFRVGDEAVVIAPSGAHLVDGYITALDVEIGRPLRIGGADKTFDLVDSTIDGTGEYKGLTARQIIERVCDPFGIGVSGEAPSTVPVYRYNINAKAIDVVRDLAARFGLLANSDGAGNLRLETIGASRADLVLKEGNNILSGAVALRETRPSTLTANGQGRTENQDSTVTGTATRHRPNNVILPGTQLAGHVSNAAQWMASLSQPESYRVQVGGIYEIRPNTLVSMDSPTLGVAGDLLVCSTAWHMDRRGHTTEFELCNPLRFGGEDTENQWML